MRYWLKSCNEITLTWPRSTINSGRRARNSANLLPSCFAVTTTYITMMDRGRDKVWVTCEKGFSSLCFNSKYRFVEIICSSSVISNSHIKNEFLNISQTDILQLERSNTSFFKTECHMNV